MRRKGEILCGSFRFLKFCTNLTVSLLITLSGLKVKSHRILPCESKGFRDAALHLAPSKQLGHIVCAIEVLGINSCHRNPGAILPALHRIFVWSTVGTGGFEHVPSYLYVFVWHFVAGNQSLTRCWNWVSSWDSPCHPDSSCPAMACLCQCTEVAEGC